MHLSLRQKLFALSMTVFLLASVAGAIGYFGLDNVAASAASLGADSQMIRNQVEGDMLHDGLRADALAALLAESPEASKEVDTDVREHAEWYRRLVRENLAMDLPADVRVAVEAVEPALERYIAAAEQIVALAAKDRDAAKKTMGSFKAAFDDLEVRNEKVTDLMVEASKAHQETAAAVRSSSRRAMIVVWAVVLGGLVGATFVTMRAITKPLQAMKASFEAVAAGDLTKRAAADTEDEIGAIGRSFNSLVDSLHGIIGDIAESASSLASASTELSSTASLLTAGAEETTSKTTTVAGAAEAMSGTMRGVAETTEDMSKKVRSVASAVEEMTVSITEVARSAERAATVAESAAQLAGASNTRISELGHAASEIGKVVNVIEEIAAQTNLLALNATIEAARAGEAGKGFAVVANEVKELAKQTSSATDDIRRRIESIQSSTTDAVRSIGEISTVIKDVNSVSRNIAAAVEEQSITARSIAGTISESSDAVNAVAHGVVDTATATHGISQNIQDVDAAARRTASGAGEAQQAADALSGLAAQLQGLVEHFRI